MKLKEKCKYLHILYGKSNQNLFSISLKYFESLHWLDCGMYIWYLSLWISCESTQRQTHLYLILSDKAQDYQVYFHAMVIEINENNIKFLWNYKNRKPTGVSPVFKTCSNNLRISYRVVQFEILKTTFFKDRLSRSSFPSPMCLQPSVVDYFLFLHFRRGVVGKRWWQWC